MWLGPGHILLVRSTRFVEEYRRFALADIQSITVTGLPDRTVLQAGLAIAAMAWIAMILAVDSTFAKGFFLVTGLIALAAIVLDVHRGPRCRCHLYTAVSRELLDPVSRLQTADRFMAALRPEIEAVQGSLEHAVEPPRESALPDKPPVVPNSPSYLPEVLFGLLLVDALLVLLDMRFPQSEAGSVLLTTFAAEVVIAIVALVRRRNHDPRRVVYFVILVAMVCIGWDGVGLGRSFGGWMQSIAEAARRQQRTQPPFVWASSHGAALFAYIWRFAAGALGLGAAFFERRRKR